MRASDGKIVVPKGVQADGTFYDISSTKKTVCQLFVENSNPLRFAAFRTEVSADGSKIFWNDFGSNKYRTMVPENGMPCEQYRDDKVDVGARPRDAEVGKMVDTYLPGSCQNANDDCSS